MYPELFQSEQAALLDALPPGDKGSVRKPVEQASRYGVEAFLRDVSDVQSGTVPITILIAATIGTFCGFACFVYYEVLTGGFKLFWEILPIRVFAPLVPQAYHWTWIPLVIMTLSLAVGVSIHLMGDPGDLKYTVEQVHEAAYIPVSHAPPIVVASLASIVGASSLGPEAPLLAICASIGGWISRNLFRQRYKNLVRRHTLCGMACATAAFFGVPLGGAVFALEINHRLGYEYFEHALAAIFSGSICLVVFRSLAGLPIGPCWRLTQAARDAGGGMAIARMSNRFFGDTARSISAIKTYNVSEIATPASLAAVTKQPRILAAEIVESAPSEILIGGLLGVFGALLAYCWIVGHKSLVRQLDRHEILKRPIPRALLGGLGICCVGLLIPQTLFWGQFELETIAMDKVTSLPNLWPPGGMSKFEITGVLSAVVVGCAKLLAISISVASGYRGGVIFPFFCAGAGFGRAVTLMFPGVIHPVIAVLTVGAGISASITRTALATPLILGALAGEPNAIPAILAASLCAVFVTSYLPFVSSQKGRDSVFESQLTSYTLNNVLAESESKMCEYPRVSNEALNGKIGYNAIDEAFA